MRLSHQDEPCVYTAWLSHRRQQPAPTPTAAAERIKNSVDWSKLPKLAAIFEHRPSVNRYWHELVALTLLSLEVNGDTLNKRNANRDG